MTGKWDAIAPLIDRHLHIFRCPVCKQALYRTGVSLMCADRHTFDLAKQGYVNLLRRPARTRYDRTLLAARQALCRSGFFAPLIQAMRDVIEQECADSSQTERLILDAGCGEGSHLIQLIDRLHQAAPQSFQGVGLDISKDGIRLAARDAERIIWCVADLARLPIQDRCCDLVLNILSPANYDEFRRIVQPQGILIKVAPGRQHLIEFRTLLAVEKVQHEASPERVIQHFAAHCELIGTHHVMYPAALEPEQVAQALVMTPLAWNVDAQQRERVLTAGITQITVDVYVLIGKMFSSALNGS